MRSRYPSAKKSLPILNDNIERRRRKEKEMIGEEKETKEEKENEKGRA